MFENSLRCLGHPSLLFSVTMLGINDHFMKRQFPGFLTGKISDFAGLYFFSFSVALAISLLPSRIEKNPQLVDRISILFVGTFFIGIKTNPLVNHQVSAILSMLTGWPTGILIDPTDLIALVSLYPAWRLWARKKDAVPDWLPWMVVGVASLASTATSCAATDTSTVRILEIMQGSIYAYGPTNRSRSDDGGMHWELLDRTNPAIIDEPNECPVYRRLCVSRVDGAFGCLVMK